MADTFLVYEDNRKDKPRELTVEEVANEVVSEWKYLHLPPDRAVNAAMASFGSFDPSERREEYDAFSKRVEENLRTHYDI